MRWYAAPGGRSSLAPRADPEPRRLAPEISVLIPFYEEEENVTPLLEELYEHLGKLGRSFEVIGVDDGSADGTFAAMSRFSARERGFRALRLCRHYGQTAAISAAIDAARGAIVVTMDGDLQNDPRDIERLLAMLEGTANAPGAGRYDVVSGWRRDRKDKELGRKVPSRVANVLVSAVSGVRLHDHGCTLKAYRREVLQGVRLYGEMHRFIAVYASWNGARVAELVVSHRARRAGRSKYGLQRTGKVILDLCVLKFLAGYTSNPIYLFGGIGLAALVGAAAVLLGALGYALVGTRSVALAPFLLAALVLAALGVLSVLLGLVAELLVRTYYESQGRRPYAVADELDRPEAGRDEAD